MVPTHSISQYAQKAYLDYAMYVVLDRALPHINDGLKPVQRRIVYAMHLLALGHKAKYKKSARTVGDVLGKFHPHGDSSCYEAMVLMAQSFSFRYPLIDGHGNWGAVDAPKSFAAMRYTEARLTAFSQVLLQEIQEGGVSWGQNFDGTLREPEYLPAQLPVVLLNGTSGIAVGMTTSIPPHNLKELVEATVFRLQNPDSSVHEVMQHMPGPDYPTGGICISTQDQLKQLYETGVGSLTLRACYRVEGSLVVIHQLPFKVSPSKVLEQLSLELQAKRIPGLIDLRDESDHSVSVRIVLVFKKKPVDLEATMQHLFAVTDLERHEKMVFNVVTQERTPKVMGLLEMLDAWLGYRRAFVIKRTQKCLDDVLARLHVLEGLLIIFDHLDEVIRIIREHEDAAVVLMQRFSLTEAQVEAILETKLRALSRLQQEVLLKELAEKQSQAQALKAILDDNKVLEALMIKEFQAVAHNFGDDRRTLLQQQKASVAFSVAHTVVNHDPIAVFVSRNGWLKVMRSHEGVLPDTAFRSGDVLLGQCLGYTGKPCVLSCVDGRFFTLRPEDLPTPRSAAVPLSSLVDLGADSGVHALFFPEGEGQKLFHCSAEGQGFLTDTADLISRMKAGKQVVTAGSTLLSPVLVPARHQEGFVVLVSNQGRLLIFPLTLLPVMKKGQGVRLMQLNLKADLFEPEHVVWHGVVPPGGIVRLQAGKRQLTLTEKQWLPYVSVRARRGKLLPQGFRAVQTVTIEEPGAC